MILNNTTRRFGTSDLTLADGNSILLRTETPMQLQLFSLRELSKAPRTVRSERDDRSSIPRAPFEISPRQTASGIFHNIF